MSTDPLMIHCVFVTLAALLIYVFFTYRVGKARGKYAICAPATTGHPEFERVFRVQQNMLEQLVLFLPAFWLFAIYVSANWATGLGAVWCLGRIWYGLGYVQSPKKRMGGFVVGMLINLVLLFGAGIGAAMAWMSVANG